MQSRAIKSHQRAEHLREGGNQEVINSHQGSSAVREHRGARAPNLATSSPGSAAVISRHQGIISRHQGSSTQFGNEQPGKVRLRCFRCASDVEPCVARAAASTCAGLGNRSVTWRASLTCGKRGGAPS